MLWEHTYERRLPEIDRLLRRAATHDGRFLADAILDLYGQHNIAASIVLRAAAASGCATICAPTNSYRCLKTRLWP